MIAALLLAQAIRSHAQASLSCQVRPTTLAAMRDCYRPLLVFSPTANDPRLRAQSSILDADADDMMDRFVMLTPILPTAAAYQPPLDAPYIVLPAQQMEAIRKRYGVARDRFLVLLLGEDGGVKLRSADPVDASRLNALIDTMPMRKIERERPHAN